VLLATATASRNTDSCLDWFALSQRIAQEAPEVADDHNAVLLNQTDSRYQSLRSRWPPK
jgi:hypothetical protein